jgi:hypothetical protein
LTIYTTNLINNVFANGTSGHHQKRDQNKRGQKNQLQHIDVFLNNYSQLLPLFPNAKEITETMGILNCLYHKIPIKINRKNPNIVCYVLGDGCTPRTGATTAISSNFKVYSIDPAMKQKPVITRLEIRKCRSQEFIEISQTAELSIILNVHSHADLLEFWKRIPSPKVAIAIPCCVPQLTDIEPTGSYKDPKIYSEKNEIVYWIK